MVLTGPLIRRRLALCMAAFFALFGALGGRLFYLQVIAGESLQRRAQAQWTSESVVSPLRGRILDRNGSVLAISATAYTASVNPRQVKNAARFGEILSPVLNMEAEKIAAKAAQTGRSSVVLKRQLSRETAQQLKSMLAEHRQKKSDALEGLVLDEDSQRFYPYGEFLSQVIGITTIDGVGQSGLEASLNDFLSGKSGKVLGEIDGKGRALSYGKSEYIAAVNGSDVTLTIDATIQGFCEKAAREAIEVNSAQSIRILAMNPNTGEILAMAMQPAFDLNDPPRDDVAELNRRMRNTLICDAYEPGSTFKVLTMAAALDAGAAKLSDGFYCSGSVYVEGGRIKCWGKPHGAETLAQGLQNSCNPVFVDLALRLGADRFYDYLEKFGVGSATGVDLSGEADGIVIARSRVKKGDLARIGFGQSVAVTPLQLLTAACSTVNGGKLMKPYVVGEILSPQGEVMEQGRATVVNRTVSEDTSRTMRQLLTSVVEKGGGKNARVEGYSVGGKTGTAQVYVDGVVSSDTHIGSFIGFAPMENPQIAVMVIVDRADVAIDYGSTTAAPFAGEILAQSLAYLGCAPTQSAETLEKVQVPDVTGMSVGQAKATLQETGLDCVLDGVGAQVIAQLPAPGADMAEGSLVMLYVEGAQAETEAVSVPDVTGLSVVEANRLLRSYGLSMIVSGSGMAVSQIPAPGEMAAPTSQVRVEFQPP